MVDSLENTKNDIMNFIKSNNFNLFNGFPKIDSEVQWKSDNKNWKDFLIIAKSENIKKIIYDDGTLEDICDGLIERIDQILESEYEDKKLVKKIKEKIESYSDIIKKIAYIQLSWIQEGICYTFQIFSPVFDKVNDYQEQIEGILEIIEDSSRKADALEKEKQDVVKKRKKIEKITQEIVQWAMAKDFEKVTRSQIVEYLLEKETYVSYDNKRLLVNMVNRKLSEQ